MKSFIAGVVQLNSNLDEKANLARAEELIRTANAQGARLVVTPENTNYLGPQPEKVARAELLDGVVCQRFSSLAKELEIYLLMGSFNEKSSDPKRCRNTSVLFGPDGGQVAIYRKIHLFDVNLSETVNFVESNMVEPGTEITVAETPLANIGMSICYDLRFGEMYRALVQRGAEIITVPAAFTKTTGEAHWEVLLRARAIETQCFLLAAAQYGHHDDDGIRESFGHASIIDPWGRMLASVEAGEGFCVAQLDAGELDRIRASMPVSSHRRL